MDSLVRRIFLLSSSELKPKQILANDQKYYHEVADLTTIAMLFLVLIIPSRIIPPCISEIERSVRLRLTEHTLQMHTRYDGWVCHYVLRPLVEMGLLRGKQLLFLYIGCMVLAVIWLFSSCDTRGTPNLPAGDEMRNLEVLAEKLKTQEQQLSDLQSELHTRERTLRQAEVHLRKTYGNIHVLPHLQAGLPIIYAITPTFARSEQKAELTRLKQTFLHIPSFHWIIVEDSELKTELVSNFLRRSGLNHTHLNVPTPASYKMAEKDPNWLKPRGVLQRNLALSWLRTNLNEDTAKGVVYFADDDNTYSLEIFDEMRSTQKVSVWPVGLVGKLRYESPIVTNGKVTGWFTYWKPERPFAMDMAGFAINLRLILTNNKAEFSNRVKRGYQESELLRHLVTMEELEPLADQCTKVLVWHTRTEKSRLDNEAKLQLKGLQSDPNIEV